jgi:hypothetical protein
MEFEYDKNNITQIKLPLLAQSTHKPNEHFPKVTESRRNEGIIQLGVLGEESCWEYETQMSENQVRTIEFIKMNQGEILKSIFEYTKNKLYPEHIGYIGFDEISFPPLNQISDLRQALGVNFVTIYIEEKENSAYYGLTCDFSGDFEHGVNIILNGAKVLGWEENLGNGLVIKDLNRK